MQHFRKLLIVNQSGTLAIEPGARAKVTGIVYRGFNVADVKQETGGGTG